jgi:hypothetical protein
LNSKNLNPVEVDTSAAKMKTNGTYCLTYSTGLARASSRRNWIRSSLSRQLTDGLRVFILCLTQQIHPRHEKNTESTNPRCMALDAMHCYQRFSDFRYAWGNRNMFHGSADNLPPHRRKRWGDSAFFYLGGSSVRGNWLQSRTKNHP